MIKLNSIIEARNRISKVVKHTPLYFSNYFSQICHNQVYLKLDNLQITGAFKIRGASNFMLQIDSSKKKKGVITASSGNHGKAVACAAKMVGLPAKVVVPTDAPITKVNGIKEFGSEIIFWGKYTKERIEKAQEIAKDENLTFIHSFNHPWIIEGQGTTGLEILEDLPEADAVLVPIGGGGYISGISVAIKEQNPAVKIYGVEPSKSNCMWLSLRENKITELEHIDTIADGLRCNKPGDLTFSIVKKYVDDILLVNDKDIEIALKSLLKEEKLLAEPSGVVTLAALLSKKFLFKDKKVVAVITGGNVDMEFIKRLL